MLVRLRVTIRHKAFALCVVLCPVSQLGHLKALLDSKAGQEDLSSITKAMGDVEETLMVVRQSIPGQGALLELQVRPADRLAQKTVDPRYEIATSLP